MSTSTACHEFISWTSPTATACRPHAPACPSSARRWSTCTWAGSAWRSPRSASRSCSMRCPTCGRRWRWRRRGRSATCACRLVPGRRRRRGEGRPARAAALQPVDLHVRLHDQEQVPRPAGPRRDHPGDGGGGPRREGGGAETVGVNAEDGSRTDDGFLLEFAPRREGGGRRPGALLRHDRRRHAGPDPANASPRWPPPTGCRWRRTATTTSAWRSPTRSPARWATSTQDRTPGSTRASTASGSAPATPTCSPRSWPSSTASGSTRDRRRARPVLGPPVRAVGELRVRSAAAVQPGGSGPQRVRARVRHPRRRRAQGPRQLRAVRRGHARPVPGRLARPSRPRGAHRRVRREGRVPPRHGRARRRAVPTRTWRSSWCSCATR